MRHDEPADWLSWPHQAYRSQRPNANPSDIDQLAYSGVSHSLLTPASLQVWIEQSSQMYAKNGITGLLMVQGSLMIEWLEGPGECIHQQWQQIVQDARLHNIVPLVHQRSVASRVFQDWSMRRISRNEMMAFVREALEVADGKHPFAPAISTLTIVLDPDLSQISTQGARQVDRA